MQNIGRMFKGVGELSSTLNTISGLAFVVVFILCIAALIMSWLVVPGLHWRTSSKNRFRKTAVCVCASGYYVCYERPGAGVSAPSAAFIWTERCSIA